MEHKAVSKQWHDKFVNATAQGHREYRTILQIVVKAIESEEKLPTGDIDEWEEWVKEREIMTIDLNEAQ